MVGAFAELERAMLKEWTKAGLDAAREEGRIGGRRPKLTPQQQTEIRKDGTEGRQDGRRRCTAVQDTSGDSQQASCLVATTVIEENQLCQIMLTIHAR
jgi:DNA invertase Pin-like site-specific DNA recombinase